MNNEGGRRPNGVLWTRSGLVLLGLALAAGYVLWAEHEVHVVAALPWLLVGGCLLMHLFMHRGHGGHGDADGPGERTDDGRDVPR